MTCPFWNRSRDRGVGKCSLGRYGGSPWPGNCLECEKLGLNREKLGDQVEKLVKPIAKALNLSCLDNEGKLKPNSPCAKRRDWLNRIDKRR